MRLSAVRAPTRLALVVQTLTVQDAVELAVVERNGFIESRHIGAAVVLSPEGEVVVRHGNSDALVLPAPA